MSNLMDRFKSLYQKFVGHRYGENAVCPYCNALVYLSFFKNDIQETHDITVECDSCHREFPYTIKWKLENMLDGHYIDTPAQSKPVANSNIAVARSPASSAIAAALGICILCHLPVLEKSAYVETKKGLAHTACVFGA